MAIVPYESAEIDTRLGAKEIVELRQHRRRLYAPRDIAYEICATYYYGEQRGLDSPAVKAMNQQGRPLLRDQEVMTASVGSEYRSNKLQPIVDDAQALEGRMPTSRVDPPDDSEQAIAKAEKQTKYLISTHELSNMDDQQEDVGYWLPCLGDAMYMLDVDTSGTRKSNPAFRRVVWQTVDPRCAYPAFKLGYQRNELLDVILYEELDPYEAKARFGSSVVAPHEQSVPVTIYMSQYQRTVVIGNEGRETIARHTPWELPFCPAVWVFNKRNGRMAQSDINQLFMPQDALDYLNQLFLDGAAFSTYAVPVRKDPTNSAGDLPPWGPGMPPVDVGPQGDFKFVSPQSDLTAIQFGESLITQDIYSGAGTSEVRQEGKLHSSIPTGRAAHALQGPQASRFELKQSKLANAIKRTNAMCMEMQEKAEHLGNHEFEIYGRMRGQSFREKFNPKADIDGWYRNSVRWDLVIGLNQQQKNEMAYQGLAAGLFDRERAIEMIGEEDPPGMVRRVERDKMKEAQMQQQMQGPPGGGPPGQGAPPGGAPPQPPQLGGGGQGGPPSPTRIARPYGLGAQQPALPTGVPKGVSLDAVKKALELVADKLKGTVGLVGDVAAQGQGQHIEALISNFKDSPVVTPILRALDPQAKVRAQDESKWPSDAVRVI